MFPFAAPCEEGVATTHWGNFLSGSNILTRVVIANGNNIQIAVVCFFYYGMGGHLGKFGAGRNLLRVPFIEQ